MFTIHKKDRSPRTSVIRLLSSWARGERRHDFRRIQLTESLIKSDLQKRSCFAMRPQEVGQSEHICVAFPASASALASAAAAALAATAAASLTVTCSLNAASTGFPPTWRPQPVSGITTGVAHLFIYGEATRFPTNTAHRTLESDFQKTIGVAHPLFVCSVGRRKLVWSEGDMSSTHFWTIERYVHFYFWCSV